MTWPFAGQDSTVLSFVTNTFGIYPFEAHLQKRSKAYDLFLAVELVANTETLNELASWLAR